MHALIQPQTSYQWSKSPLIRVRCSTNFLFEDSISWSVSGLALLGGVSGWSRDCLSLQSWETPFTSGLCFALSVPSVCLSPVCGGRRDGERPGILSLSLWITESFCSISRNGLGNEREKGSRGGGRLGNGYGLEGQGWQRARPLNPWKAKK